MVAVLQNPILLIGHGSDTAAEVVAPLAAAGYALHIGSVADLKRRSWALVITPPALPGMGGLELIAELAAGSQFAPRLLVIGRSTDLPRLRPAIETLAWPASPSTLVQRVQALTDTVAPVLKMAQPELPKLALLEEAEFLRQAETEREELRAGLAAGESYLASVRLHEFDGYRGRLPRTAVAELMQQLAQLAQTDALPSELQSTGAAGEFLLLLPGVRNSTAQTRLQRLSGALANHQFHIAGQSLTFSPVIGYDGLKARGSATEALAHAREAGQKSALHLDLHPELWTLASTKPERKAGPVRAWCARIYQHHLLIFQYLLTMVLGLGAPFLVYWGLGSNGLDISGPVYGFVVVSLFLTAVSIWWEGFLALRRQDPPEQPASPYPRASAIIAAYLPNEAPIIEASVRAFLRLQYPGPLQVILAYNTPKEMPEIEERLAQISREDPRFVSMRIRTSTSKAQNVNAVLPYATGEFTAVFDADHQPDPESFRRAWRWISHGADVVQGHCLIRNGQASWVAKMVAIEFEQIYAVSHPGRARLHGFGIFGGSNGYWRTSLLRELRMHGFMLTEDIDSSMRAVIRGKRIVSDPYLVSRELAPETLQALTKQRLRWAQGWLQISMKWIRPALRARNLSLRQKFGMLQLLAWREVYPWISMQILPLVAWWAVEAGSLWRIEWFVPLFIVTSLFTLTTGPGQIIFTYRLADAQIRKHASWFWFYLVASTFFYAGLKNAWNRIAHYKEFRSETSWVVTPRVRNPKKTCATGQDALQGPADRTASPGSRLHQT